MNIKKEKLADLENVYAINFMNMNGAEYCIAASEGRDGNIALINCDTKSVQLVEGLDGGIMSVIPIKGEEGAFFAIQRFYPVFKSEGAEIVKAVIKPGALETVYANVELVTPLPFVHRIWQSGKEIIAASLCAEKKFEQDWSSSGAVYAVELEGASGGEAVKRVIVDGIHKNHGMFEYNGSILISGEEGVFALKNDGGWTHENWISTGVSDLCLYDLDGDGKDELIAIAPFHGDSLQIFRMSENGWACTAEEKLAFGHAVWAGKIGEASCIIACSRGGEKETILYKVSALENGSFKLEGTLIDSGVGATNVIIRQEGGDTALYAANHGNNEVAKYTISL